MEKFLPVAVQSFSKAGQRQGGTAEMPSTMVAAFRVWRGGEEGDFVVGELGVRLGQVSYSYPALRHWAQEGATVTLCPTAPEQEELQLVAASEADAERISSAIGAY